MKNKKGYTLVELIITLAVIGIMVVPIFNSFIESHRINVISKRRIVSSHLAQSRMEEIKSFDLDMLKAEFGNAIDTSDSSTTFTDGSKAIERNGINYIVTTSLVNVTEDLKINSAVGNPNLNKITAELTLKVPTSGNQASLGVVNTTDILIGSTNVTLIIGVDPFGYYILLDGTDRRVFAKNGDIELNIECDMNPDSWNINIVNLCDDNTSVNVKVVNDLSGMVEVQPSPAQVSTSNIWIGNSMFTDPGKVQAKQWYNVVVDVEQNGTTYEIFESTIGK